MNDKDFITGIVILNYEVFSFEQQNSNFVFVCFYIVCSISLCYKINVYVSLFLGSLLLMRIIYGFGSGTLLSKALASYARTPFKEKRPAVSDGLESIGDHQARKE